MNDTLEHLVNVELNRAILYVWKLSIVEVSLLVSYNLSILLICAVFNHSFINLYRNRQLPPHSIWREILACTHKNPIPLYLG